MSTSPKGFSVAKVITFYPYYYSCEQSDYKVEGECRGVRWRGSETVGPEI
jgi:hypothetical protein